MQQAIFITGFNNWGKTRIISDLFGRRSNFGSGRTYRLTETSVGDPFAVDSHSNDDFLGNRWIDERIQRRMVAVPPVSLITALCPSIEPGNHFVELLSNPLFSQFEKLHIFLIEHKWEYHAHLDIPEVIKVARTIPTVNIVTINADAGISRVDERHIAKMAQIRREIELIFR